MCYQPSANIGYCAGVLHAAGCFWRSRRLCRRAACRPASTASSRSTPRPTAPALTCCAWLARPHSRSGFRLPPGLLLQRLTLALHSRRPRQSPPANSLVRRFVDSMCIGASVVGMSPRSAHKQFTQFWSNGVVFHTSKSASELVRVVNLQGSIRQSRTKTHTHRKMVKPQQRAETCHLQQQSRSSH